MLAHLQNFISTIPVGSWAVGVSGGADSVALLSLLLSRSDLSLRVVHLDHQTREGASTQDARFVESLALRWNIPCDIATLAEIEPELADATQNPSARYRAARLALFRRVAREHQLAGVILAHHADDQAETILLRLLRGSSYVGLTGIASRSVIKGLVIHRPLLGVSRALLRDYLRDIAQHWREDTSNDSPDYARNRVRKMLRQSPDLTGALIALGEGCHALRNWAQQLPTPASPMRVKELQNLPSILAREQARKWLASHGAPPDELDPATLDRLIQMANDLATPARQQFPGAIMVARRRGVMEIFA